MEGLKAVSCCIERVIIMIDSIFRLARNNETNMIKYLILFFAVIASMSSYGVSLDGIWLEDKEKTIQWSIDNLKSEPAYLEKLAAISGHMYFSFSDGIRCQFFEPYTMKYRGNEKKVERYSTLLAKYEIIGKNQYGFVMNITYPDNQEAIDMLIYENEESFYAVTLTTEEYGHPGSRTYFKKVAPVKWDYDCK